MNGEHTFTDSHNNRYEVKVLTTNVLKGILECHFYKNGEVQKTYECRFKFGQLFNLKFIVMLLLGSILTGVLVGLGYLPEFAIYIFVIVVLIINSRLSKSRGFAIVEMSN